MKHIQGGDRNQTLLLPVAVDEYVGRDNPVRFIEAFVDQCDLQEAGFRRVQPNDTGRPGYDPADLLKLYIYGYVYGHHQIALPILLPTQRHPGNPQIPDQYMESESADFVNGLIWQAPLDCSHRPSSQPIHQTVETKSFALPFRP